MDKIIYLQDAKDAVREIIYNYNGIYDNRSQYGVILDAMNRLDRIPPAIIVQPERKMGRWIKDKPWSEGAGMGESYGYYWRCDQCNHIVKGDWSQCGDNFCSECGADMRGEENEIN